MWLKRKEYEDMKNVIMDLKKEVDNLKIGNRIFNERLNSLKRLHEKTNNKGYLVLSHNIQTKTIPDVILEELAKYVIDGEPFVREDTIKVKKIYE